MLEWQGHEIGVRDPLSFGVATVDCSGSTLSGELMSPLSKGSPNVSSNLNIGISRHRFIFQVIGHPESACRKSSASEHIYKVSYLNHVNL